MYQKNVVISFDSVHVLNDFKIQLYSYGDEHLRSLLHNAGEHR